MTTGSIIEISSSYNFETCRVARIYSGARGRIQIVPPRLVLPPVFLLLEYYSKKSARDRRDTCRCTNFFQCIVGTNVAFASSRIPEARTECGDNDVTN